MADEYPEHEKVKALGDRKTGVSDFLNWLSEQGYHICETTKLYDLPYSPVAMSFEQLMAEHFGVDLDRMEREKRAMLDVLRQAHEKRDKERIRG